MKKKDWLERLVKERDRTNKRLGRLVEFIDTEQYKNIDPRTQQLILIQSTAMATYVNAMNGRLKLLDGTYV